MERQLQVDQSELVKVQSELTRPAIDAASLAAGRAAFRAKYEEAQQAKAQELRQRAMVRERNARKSVEVQQDKSFQAKDRDLGRSR